MTWAFDNIENKHTLYGGKDCMKKFCKSLREHVKNIIKILKRKNVTVNKRKTKISSRSKSMLHLWKKNFTKAH